MEEPVQICPSCGKQNPSNARFCFSCGASLVAGAAQVEQTAAVPPPIAEAPFQTAETPRPAPSYAQAQPQYVEPTSQAAPPPAAMPSQPPQGYPAPGYPSVYPPPSYPPTKPPRRRWFRFCAIGCLVVLVVLLIGLPILHVTVLRPAIEREIYTQVQKSLAEVNQNPGNYYGTDTETITERQFNQDARDYWNYLPGASDGYIYFQQDQIKLDVRIYGIKVWAAGDIRVNNRGELVVKSVKMHWLLQVLFTEGGLKREIADYANTDILRPKGIYLLAFQVTDGNLYIAYEPR